MRLAEKLDWKGLSMRQQALRVINVASVNCAYIFGSYRM
jgi:hypothetical protein